MNDLAEQYDVTTETVRRDLSVLERGGLVRRVHGGAVPAAAPHASLETGLGERDLAHAEEKDRIAEAALDLLPPGDGSVLIDAGTTTARLADAAPPRPAAHRRHTRRADRGPARRLRPVELHLLPGRVRPTTQAAVGEDTVEALGQAPRRRRVRRHQRHLRSATVCPRRTTTRPPSSARMVASAHRVVVLADSSKIGRERTVRFAELAEVDVLVTDGGIAADDRAALETAGVEVVVA